MFESSFRQEDLQRVAIGIEYLTRREAQVLACILDGLTSKECARILDVSQRTVETHRMHVWKKLGGYSWVVVARMISAINCQNPQDDDVRVEGRTGT